ncbi:MULTISPECIES: IS66-like element accessory protein TnpA [Bradyrhizobium]|uniref:IS66-like element accessory protein TnpA n=1 Tax=Bradyrhizobium TaxID=374 RepID=UPI001AD76295|nr:MULTISPECIES: transposase [Bradyrhizobium]MBO4228596.1 transposase [Bradyrhizobium neotropicale]MCA1455183.1 transposase [Bradyrhizobium sp. BRP22]
MTTQRVEVITSVERRRRWSREEKERLVAAMLEPGASVSEIARLAGIHVSQLFRWRKQLCRIPAPSAQFIPLEIVEALPPPPTPAASPTTAPLKPVSTHRPRRKPSMVTVELGGGRRLRVESDVDTEALGRILDVLERR